MRIKFFTTGGTIDKVYFDAKSEFEVGPPQVLEVVKEANVTFDYDIESILQKDSLDMTQSDRDLVRQKVAAEPCPRIVITHGTDTMEQTAAVLGQAVSGKTIVLTGAMVPYTFGSSDGMFNLGTALAFVQALDSGVYVAMNGRCFTWNKVHKNREFGIFEAR